MGVFQREPLRDEFIRAAIRRNQWQQPDLRVLPAFFLTWPEVAASRTKPVFSPSAPDVPIPNCGWDSVCDNLFQSFPIFAARRIRVPGSHGS